MNQLVTGILSNRYKWLPHPTVLFLLSVSALAITLFLCIFWYIEVKNGLEELIGRLNYDPLLIFQSRTWIVIIILTLVGGVVLAGMFMSFVYYQKVLQLYSHQQNFINNFTHELKTPVTSLKLYLETFLKHDLTREDQNKYLKYMLADVSRLSANISSILDLARLESDQYDGDMVPSDVVVIIDSFVKNNAHLFTACDITIENKLKKPWVANLDLQLFEMLLMNIITNSIKYTTADRCRITIEFTTRRNRLAVRFRDNGIGIDKKELSTIFRKFYQAQSPCSTYKEGSGLGLYLVTIITKLHGGTIRAKSQGIGHGSEFILTLPGLSVIDKLTRN